MWVPVGGPPVRQEPRLPRPDLGHHGTNQVKFWPDFALWQPIALYAWWLMPLWNEHIILTSLSEKKGGALTKSVVYFTRYKRSTGDLVTQSLYYLAYSSSVCFPLGLYMYGCELGCFRKCIVGIPRNTELYTELTFFHVIPCNSAKFFTVQYRGIPYRFVYTDFRIPSNENTILEPITKDLWKLLLYFEVKGTEARDFPPPFFFITSTTLDHDSYPKLISYLVI